MGVVANDNCKGNAQGDPSGAIEWWLMPAGRLDGHSPARRRTLLQKPSSLLPFCKIFRLAWELFLAKAASSAVCLPPYECHQVSWHP